MSLIDITSVRGVSHNNSHSPNNVHEEVFGSNKKSKNPKNSHNPNEHKYREKFLQVLNAAESLKNQQTQEQIQKDFGKIVTPDVMCYTAINGLLKKKFYKELQSMKDYYHDWQNNNFEADGILAYCNEDLQNLIRIVADENMRSQKYLTSRKFLANSHKKINNDDKVFLLKLKTGETIFFTRIWNWNPQNGQFASILKYSANENLDKNSDEWILLSKSVYFLNEQNMEKIYELLQK